jgi:hypothetical protein
MALVGMCMSLRNLSKSFNSDQSQNQDSVGLTLLQISHLPTTIDMVTFEFLLT